MFRARIDAHIVGAWFHMVAASDAGVKSRSMRRPRSGATVSALAVDAVALNAGEGLEQLRAARGVRRDRGRVKRPMSRRRKQDHKRPFHRVNLSPVVTRLVRKPS